MIRILIVLLLYGLPIFCLGQAKEATLLGIWQDSDLPQTTFNGRYNEVWGIAINGLEIAIIGSTEGTHFIDVSNPENPVELLDAFVPGAAQGGKIINRDFHTFRHYAYAVADQNASNGDKSSLQIIDLSDLPHSTKVVYDSEELINRSHNIFIDEDNARLYACAVKVEGQERENLAIYSLANPEKPEKLAAFPSVAASIPYVHDAYVDGHKAFLNCGSSGGLQVYDFTHPDAPQLLTILTGYPQAGYNHSGWLDPVHHYYYMGDETHGKDLKVVDVCAVEDAEVVATFNAASAPSSIAHNLILNCNLLYVSYYYDGLQVFDVSDPLNPQRVAYYDTYPGADSNGFRGAWGVYPLLPSGNILISDMNAGLHVFEALPTHCATYTASPCNGDPAEPTIHLFPQPASDYLNISLQNEGIATLLNAKWYDLSGRLLLEGSQAIRSGQMTLQIRIAPHLPTGIYLLQISGSDIDWTGKVVIGNP